MAAAMLSSKMDGYLSSPFTFGRWPRSTNLIGWQQMRFCNSKAKIRRQRRLQGGLQRGLRLPKSFCLVESSSKADSSSSSSDSCSGSSYKVFLSFSGKDVRTNFADHLYTALVDSGIRTFRDDDELRKGNEIGPELITAIQESRISIPIFSMNCGASKWCLDELFEMYECSRTMKQIVFPIFYKIEPGVVRHQTGLYELFFNKHRTRYDEETVQKWKKALKEIGEMVGFHCKQDTHEAKLIKIAVKTVWSELNTRPSIVSNNLVGIQCHIEKMLTLLDIEFDGRKIVGIHGLGGLGKTTIARAVYNTIFHHFEGYSFLENIRENAQKHGLPHLQNQLIFDILKQGNHNFTSEDDGINVLQQRFREKKVLIVLDDVDQDIHVKCLAGDREWFGIGSKIIITSRNEDVLRAQEGEIYKPNVMDLDHSLQPFSHHAFRRDQPPEDFLELSKAVVKTTGGLPLALQVIGSSLSCMKKSEWEHMLKKLQKVPNDDIMKRLKTSYDGLDDTEQQMFLDTACFFIGMSKDIASCIWDGCGFFPQVGLRALCARSLISINENDELKMHDLLRDLGREIVCQESIKEPGKRTRIWSQEEVLDVLDTQMGTRNVEGVSIYFDCKSMRKYLISGQGCAAMTKLRLLKVADNTFSLKFMPFFPELRWLSWEGLHDPYVPTNFHPRKLAVLDLSYSNVTENWMGWNCIKMAGHLKVLHLKDCYRLKRTPNLSANQQLEVLILKDCAELIDINTSIGYLEKLVKLDLSGCNNIVDLPNEILQLTSLERLILRDCRNLTKLPEKLDHMISLTVLDLTRCFKLESLPNLPQNLKELILDGCLYLSEVSKSLPFSLKFSELGIKYGWNPKSHRMSIQNISGLPYSLTHLKVKTCFSIQNISDLPSNLTHLEVEECPSIQYISDLPSNLTHLLVRECSSIRCISDLPSSLISLDVSSCKSLKKLSTTTGLRNLETLFLKWCDGLEEIEGFDKGLRSLVSFTMCGKSFKKFPNLAVWKKLRRLKVVDCVISDFKAKRMYFLEELGIKDCPQLRKISNLSDPIRLRKLEINSCYRLIKIVGVEDCEFLETLTVTMAISLEKLPDLSNLKILRVLKIENCWKLIEIPGLDRLESMRELKIRGCMAIKRLPDLSHLKYLNDVVFEDYPSLTILDQSMVLTDWISWRVWISECESFGKITGSENFKGSGVGIS